MHKIYIFFPESLNFFVGFTSKLRYGRAGLFFLSGLSGKSLQAGAILYGENQCQKMDI